MEMTNLIRVLVVEDDESQASVIRMLLKTELGAEVAVAGSCDEARRMMSTGTFELVTIDYLLPDGNGLDLLEEITAAENHPAVLMVTGHGDEQTAVNAFKHGASGYVVKDKRMPTLLVEEAKSALVKSALERTEIDLFESRGELMSVYEGIVDGVLVADHQTRKFVRTNPAMCEMLGYSESELLSLSISDIHPPDELGTIYEFFEMIFEDETSEARSIHCLRKDGTLFDVDIRGRRITYRGRPSELGMFRDITEHNRAEQALMKSEQRFRSLAFAATDGIVLMDDEGTVTYMNPAAEAIFGYSMEEAVGGRAHVLFAPEDMRDEYASLLGAFARRGNGIVIEAKDGGEAAKAEFPAMKKEGTRFIVEASGSSMLTEERWQIILTVRDVTARREAMDALETSEEMFRKLADASAAGIIIYQGSKFVYVNEAAAAMTGYARDELLTLDFWDVAEPGFRDMVKERGMARQRGEKVPDRYMLPYVTKDGDHHFSDFSASEIEYQGAPAGIATIVDVTHLVRIEEELRAANAELQGFAHTVSHDVKAPLAAARAGVEAFKQLVEKSGDEFDADLARELPEVILRSLVKAGDLVEDLLALAVSRQGDITSIPVEIEKVMLQVADENDAEIRRRGGSLSFDNDLGIILANPTQVYQVFSNLVRNAFQHNTASVPMVEVVNVGDETPGVHRYMVRDNGDGIPELLMERLFDPFLAGPGGGTGIGLAIVSKIVASYGGEIRAFNDGGACVEFTLVDRV